MIAERYRTDLDNTTGISIEPTNPYPIRLHLEWSEDDFGPFAGGPGLGFTLEQAEALRDLLNERIAFAKTTDILEVITEHAED